MSRVASVACAIALLGCSKLQELGAGPAVAIGEGRPRWGAALAAESIEGNTSPEESFVGAGAGGRAAITEHAIDAAPVLSVHGGASFGRVFLDGTTRLGPGLQVRLDDGHVLPFVSLGGGLSAGYALIDTGWQQAQSWFNVGPPDPRPGGAYGPDGDAVAQAERWRAARYSKRSRLLFTTTLAADVDVRFTRSPLLVLGLLLGVAWLDELSLRDGAVSP